MITPHQVEGIIASSCGRASVSGIRPLASGMLNHVYRARLDNPARDIVIRERHFSDPEYGQCFAAEQLAYPLLAKGKPRVPAFLGADEDGRFAGNPLAVFSFVEGTRLDELLEAPPSRRLLEALASALAHVHGVAAPGFGTLRGTTHGPEDAGSFWQDLFEAEAKALARFYPSSSEKLKLLIPDWVNEIRKAPAALVSPTLVHGDFHARNIIVEDAGDPILIDWEAARFRSPAYDLVQILALNLAGHDGAAAAFLTHYFHARQISASREQALTLIDVFMRFWRIRMGLFMCLNDVPGCSYFGRQSDYRRYLQEGCFLEF